ncbi:DUF5018-related domain-containing protein [Bacteroides helcogenes]|uniref:DUF5018 domain-containing protein n=1 Tax=Bacteroides helcogenes (strain ATCC 35417 / DSM 20613 / JCM 6297 / CCUG 15421 / P 36-108) TaxID=693979 RepID=E6SPA5_BACT6|nr:hypothetical protein [Bacteroides helcogenes]ADV44862.1 hypothetical protein Bache_2927 [Bacteroides helcogenes P 36-108]MDY5239719.1 hypothetical protein [Bacteroides helcogenes]
MKRIYLTILLMLPLMLTSCIKSGLEDIEVFHDADITSIRGLYYYYDTEVSPTGSQLFDWGNISRADVTIDKDAATIVVGKATPAAANVNQFDAKKVVMMLNISTAATIEPVEGSSALGVESDWTAGKANKYKVTAADGTVKIWTVTIQSYVLN